MDLVANNGFLGRYDVRARWKRECLALRAVPTHIPGVVGIARPAGPRRAGKPSEACSPLWPRRAGPAGGKLAACEISCAKRAVLHLRRGNGVLAELLRTDAVSRQRRRGVAH